MEAVGTVENCYHRFAHTVQENGRTGFFSFFSPPSFSFFFSFLLVKVNAQNV
jgi:hypothetical protein